MTKRGLGILSAPVILVALALAAPGTAEAAGWAGNINFLYARRAADSGDWKPIDRSTAYAIETTWGKTDQPLHLAVDYYWFSAGEKSKETTPRISVQGQELAVGLRKIWEVKFFRPYAGAGVSYIWESLNEAVPSGRHDLKDRTTGFWVGGGAFCRLGEHFNLGMAVRYTAAKNLQLGESLDASGGMIGLTFGVGWGGGKAK